MPISKELRQHIENKIKPYGKVKWVDVAMDKVREIVGDKSDLMVLDAGCGVDSWITRVIRQVCQSTYVIGVDVDPSCVENKDVDKAVIASLTELPLDADSVDLIVSAWVVEHIEEPSAALSEMYRVLKPGGSILFWTSNLYNPAMLVARATPHRFHTWFRRLNTGDEHADTTPTFYRMNTTPKIRKLAAEVGFACEYAERFSSAYNYFGMSKVSYVLACAANKAAALWPLSLMRLTLICVLKKPIGDC